MYDVYHCGYGPRRVHCTFHPDTVHAQYEHPIAGILTRMSGRLELVAAYSPGYSSPNIFPSYE